MSDMSQNHAFANTNRKHFVTQERRLHTTHRQGRGFRANEIYDKQPDKIHAIMMAALCFCMLASSLLSPSVVLADTSSELSDAKTELADLQDKRDGISSERDDTQHSLDEAQANLNTMLTETNDYRIELRDTMRATYKNGIMGCIESTIGMPTVSNAMSAYACRDDMCDAMKTLIIEGNGQIANATHERDARQVVLADVEERLRDANEMVNEKQANIDELTERLVEEQAESKRKIAETLQTVGVDASNVEVTSELGARVAEKALTQVGVPYVAYANEWNKALDCSGLTYCAYQQAGVNIPRNQNYQHGGENTQCGWVRRNGDWKTSIDQLEVGDIVFYGATWNNTQHVGIYIGNGMNIEGTGPVAKVMPVYEENWHPTWHTFIGGGSPV